MARRQQYFRNRPQVLLPSGIVIYIKYLEVYPESIGLVIPDTTQDELVVLVGEGLEIFLSGKVIGKKMDDEGRFIEQVTLVIDRNQIDAYAKFELVQEGFIYLIRLIYVA